jgi:hypothetical protein
MAFIIAFFIIAAITIITYWLLHDRGERYSRIGDLARRERQISIPYKRGAGETIDRSLIGKWQLTRGSALGTVVEVVELNGRGQFSGSVIRVSDNRKVYFRRGEIVWQNVVTVGRNNWVGIVIGKRPAGLFNRDEVSIVRVEGRFTLVHDDVLEIVIGETESRWMRVR